jgi:uncharacterized protein YjiS (DUF1127 family)
MIMTTQRNLKLEQLPYGHEAALVSELLALPGKAIAGIGKLFAALGEAIELRNRYLELNGLSDAGLSQLGIRRETIPQVIALEAGLIDTQAAPAANNNLRAVRPAA